MRQAVIIFGMISLDSLVAEYTGLQLSPAQMQAMNTFQRELLDWNTRINLTAIRKPEEVRVKHFLDSLTSVLVMRDTPVERVIDIGTGAGFPGIPLKIICPTMRLTLVESVGKKADFCRFIIDALKLEGARVIQGRAEVLGQMDEHRERYDWAAARAVALMPVLAEFLLPLVRIGGKILAMKGEAAHAEAQSAERAIHLLGGRIRQVVPVALPGVADERFLVVADKIHATPKGYPRKVGLPGKKPL